MTKGQKRWAAIVLCLLGIYGTLEAMESRIPAEPEMAVTVETTVTMESKK